MHIVGLGHYSRTGKDTFANYLIESLHEFSPLIRARKVSWAWKLKDICFQLYGWAGMREPEFYETPEGEPYRDIVLPAIRKTPVEIWVGMGTPAVRGCVYDRTWIDWVLNTFTAKDWDVIVIPDVRFHNEIDAIRKTVRASTIAKIVRPGRGPRNTVADRMLVGYDGWDYLFGHTGKLSDLRVRASQVAAWIAGFGAKPTQTPWERRACEAAEVISPEVRAAIDQELTQAA